jgi:hypothetical protein
MIDDLKLATLRLVPNFSCILVLFDCPTPAVRNHLKVNNTFSGILSFPIH